MWGGQATARWMRPDALSFARPGYQHLNMAGANDAVDVRFGDPGQPQLSGRSGSNHAIHWANAYGKDGWIADIWIWCENQADCVKTQNRANGVQE